MGCQAHQARMTGLIVITEIEYFHKLELILIPIIQGRIQGGAGGYSPPPLRFRGKKCSQFDKCYC